MNQFLETLKVRMADAQSRLQAATQELQAAQVKHQAVAQEFGSLQVVYQIEMRKEQGNSSVPQVPQGPQLTVTFQANKPPTQTMPSDRSEMNKTEVIRQLLQQHPAGMTPTDLWKAVGGQIKHRPYLYSILKRLKDKDDVFLKRGKYFPKMKQEEGKEQHVMIQ